MTRQSVHIETSVVSYLTARPIRDIVIAAHQQVTMEWREKSLPRLEPYVSLIVIEEASKGGQESSQITA
jgi:hypothetical protein